MDLADEKFIRQVPRSTFMESKAADATAFIPGPRLRDAGATILVLPQASF